VTDQDKTSQKDEYLRRKTETEKLRETRERRNLTSLVFQIQTNSQKQRVRCSIGDNSWNSFILGLTYAHSSPHACQVPAEP
jgi:hypothetical protein